MWNWETRKGNDIETNKSSASATQILENAVTIFELAHQYSISLNILLCKKIVVWNYHLVQSGRVDQIGGTWFFKLLFRFTLPSRVQINICVLIKDVWPSLFLISFSLKPSTALLLSSLWLCQSNISLCLIFFIAHLSEIYFQFNILVAHNLLIGHLQ